MILKALYDYYYRSGDDVAPEGLEYKEIAFAIVIDKEGNFKSRIENRIGETKLVSKSNGRTGTKSQPNHLWDNIAYVLGISAATLQIGDESLDKIKREKRDKELQKNERNHAAFVDYVSELSNIHPTDVDLRAVSLFYKKNTDLLSLLQNCDIWDVLKRNLTKNISFLIEGDLEIVAEKSSILSYLHADNEESEDSGTAICLVSGEKCTPIKTFTKIQLGKFSDTKLVSFQKNQGYDSYGKEQGENATMSKSAEFAVSTALRKLLAFDSRNKFMVGSRVFAFWTVGNSEADKEIEESIFSLFGNNPNEDNPNDRIELVSQVFRSVYSGDTPTQTDDMFYILGMFPANKARIAVSYWEAISVRDFAGRILQHIDDMEIVDGRLDKKPYIRLFNILGAVTLGGKSSDATPNLPDAVVKSIFQGLPYPASLFQSCIRRIRAEQSINITRAAIIKAYLNRLNDNNNNKITVMLDKTNQNPGYLCGRLFAVVEDLQYAANKQDTIRSSYMNAASATPAAVFSTILKLSNSHYGKLAKDKKGLAVFFDKQKQEIMEMLSDFPETLDLQDQGRFFLGYYHQKNYKENND